MKILHITSAYEPAWHLGGVMRSVSQLCRGLVQQGHDVTVFTTDSGYDRRMPVPLNQQVDIAGVKVFYFKTDYSLSFFFSKALWEACLTAVKKFDIVHLASPYAFPDIAGAMAAKRANVPYLISTHGRLVIKYNPRKFFKKWVYHHLVRGADYARASAIHYTAELEREQSDPVGLQADSFIVPNGVDITEFDHLPERSWARTQLGLGSEDLIVVYLGRIEPRKALDVLIRAFAKVVHAGRHPVKLIVAGPDFGSLGSLQLLCENLGISDQVLFPGFIPPEKRNLLLSAADLMALVSHPGENFGISALEGMLAGLPLLLSNNVGFSREVIPYGVGVEVAVEEDSIAHGLQRMLNDPAGLKAMGRTAGEVARARYGITAVTKKMSLAYEDILTGSRSPELVWAAGTNRSPFSQYDLTLLRVIPSTERKDFGNRFISFNIYGAPHKFFLDFTSRATGGGITFLNNFILNLANIKTDNIYYLFTSGRLPFNLPPNFKLIQVTPLATYEFWKFFWHQLGIRNFIEKEKIDLFYGSTGITPFNINCPIVLTLQNLWPFLLSKSSLFINLEKYSRKLYINKCTQLATLIHFASFSSYQEHLSLGLNITKDKARIIPFGIHKMFFDKIDSVSSYNYLKSLNLANKKYILFVGNIYEHKNILTLLKAFAFFSQRTGSEYYLVIAGKVMEKNYFRKILYLINFLAIQNKVIFLGEINYNKLPALYQAAKLFVFPSLLETFGFPMIEAMSSGVPLLVADTPIGREMCEDASVYFPIFDHERLASLMLRVIEDDDLKESLISKGLKIATNYTWEKMSENMLQLFSEAILIK